VPSAEADHPADEPGGAVSPSSGASFRVVGEETIFRGHIFSVVHATVSTHDGTRFERDIVRHPGAVAVVAVTDAGSVVLIEQYRAPVDHWILEIPAGTRDVEGEPPEETARRELVEEAGYRAERMDLLTEILNTPGFCDESTCLYLATGLTPVPHERQGFEEQQISVVEVLLDRFDAMVDDGSIVDAQTILGVGLARRRLATGD
jgi:8-oxo-dGTP pyrophosphatase MutT (NUDIX family)